MATDESGIEGFRLRMREQGFRGLENEIVLRELCSGCGACSAVCPRNVIEFGRDGLPVMKGNAECITCGLCAIHCPTSFMYSEEIESALFKGQRDELGHHVQVIAARAVDPGIRAEAQDGGVVSAILKHGFERRRIDGAAVCKADDRFVGFPFLAKSWDEARPAARSKYNLSPNLVALRWARQEKLEKVALVGLPCHLAAFRKLEFNGPESLTQRVAFTVGIFCSENFCERMVTELLPGRGIDPKAITKLDIKGNFKAQAENRLVEIPLEEMKSVINPGCLACRDFTAEFGDISVGAAGAPEGWCTMITRTEKGDEMLSALIRDGMLETGALTKPKTLRRMSRSKRYRGNLKLFELMRKEAALPLKAAEVPVEEEGENK